MAPDKDEDVLKEAKAKMARILDVIKLYRSSGMVPPADIIAEAENLSASFPGDQEIQGKLSNIFSSFEQAKTYYYQQGKESIGNTGKVGPYSAAEYLEKLEKENEYFNSKSARIQQSRFNKIEKIKDGNYIDDNDPKALKKQEAVDLFKRVSDEKQISEGREASSVLSLDIERLRSKEEKTPYEKNRLLQAEQRSKQLVKAEIYRATCESEKTKLEKRHGIELKIEDVVEASGNKVIKSSEEKFTSLSKIFKDKPEHLSALVHHDPDAFMDYINNPEKANIATRGKEAHEAIKKGASGKKVTNMINGLNSESKSYYKPTSTPTNTKTQNKKPAISL